jgi:uncharacterized protein YbjT (DUF2867 family)
MMIKTIVIFGGSGFVGRVLAKKLTDNKMRVKIVTRCEEKAKDLKTIAGPDFLSVIEWDYKDQEVLERILLNSDGVVNLVGILVEDKKNSFEKIHVDLTRNLAEKSSKMAIKYFVYNSALAIKEASDSSYALSKLMAEKALQKYFPNATILRPSIIFGKDDNFFNRFRKLINISPFLPLIGGGNTKFQPIFVDDVAEIIFKALNSDKYQGKIYEIAGDEIYSFRQLIRLLEKSLRKKTYNRICLFKISFSTATLIAWMLQIFTKNILTTDQVKLLKVDNILSDNSFKKDFEITPKSLKAILPKLLN